MLGKEADLPPNNYTQTLGVLAIMETTEMEEPLQNLHFYFPKLSQKNNSKNMMEDMWSYFGKDNIKFRLDISLSYLPTEEKSGELPQPLITLNDLDRMQFNTDNLGFLTVESSIVQPLIQLWEQGMGSICCKFTLAVTLNEVVVDQVNLFSVESSELLDHNQKLLEEEMFTDLEIECESGKMIKCHKAVLAGESKIIQTVLENHKPKYLAMKDMSEQSVKAVLAYVYCRKVEQTVNNFELALQLLKAGLKFEFKGLTKAMKEIFMWKRSDDIEWFSVKNTIKLFMLVRSREEVKNLQDKAVRVLKSFGNHSGDQLRDSEEYQNLFKRVPEAALELSLLFCAI